jgi:hypothetical protein
MYPYAQKSEIENIIQEMLEANIIQPSQSDLSSPVVLVTKKDGSWCIYPYYIQINKMNIKYKFLIPVIDEFQGIFFFY